MNSRDSPDRRTRGAGARRPGVGLRGARGLHAAVARSSLARAPRPPQSGAGCGDVNCIGEGRDRSVGRDVFTVPCAGPILLFSTECFCVPDGRLRSSLRLRTPHQQTVTPDSRNGKRGRRSRSRFVYVGPPALLLSRTTCRQYPLSPLHTSLSIVFCFPKSRHLRRRPRSPILLRRGCVFVAVHLFCSVFSQVAATSAGTRWARLHSGDEYFCNGWNRDGRDYQPGVAGVSTRR